MAGIPDFSPFTRTAQACAERTTGIPGLALLRQSGLIPSPPPNSVVLDNACGMGILTARLLENLNPGQRKNVSIVSGDTDLTMLKLAKERFQDERLLELVDLQQINAEDISGYSDGHFTHVLMNFGPQLMKDAMAMLKESHRVLGNNGTIGFTCWLSAGWLPSIREVFPEFKPGATPLSQPTWKDPEIITSTLKAVGFKDVKASKLEFVETREEDLDSYLELMGLLMSKLLVGENKSKYEKHMREKQEKGPIEMKWQALIVTASKQSDAAFDIL